MNQTEWMDSILKTHVDKYNPPQSEVDHIIDYLNYSTHLKLHSRISYDQIKKNADRWTEQLNKKSLDLLSSGKIELIVQIRPNLKLVRLVDQEAKNWEGKHMGHCVATYKDHEGIYSLRDAAEIPHCTFEIAHDMVYQIKGRANGKVSIKYIQAVIDCLAFFPNRINRGQFYNIGYNILNDKTWETLNTHFKGVKSLRWNNELLFYSGNKLKMIKPITEFNSELFNLFQKNNTCNEALEILVRLSPYKGYIFDSALLDAIKPNHIEIVKIFAHKVTNKPDIMESALRQAINHKRLEILKHLSTLYKPSTEFIFSQIRYACENRDLDLIKFIIKSEINIHKSLNNFLHFAVTGGSLDVVKYLLELGAEINYKNPITNKSALSIAAIPKRYEIFKYLLESGAKPSDFDVITVIHKGNLDMVKLMVKAKANIHIINNDSSLLEIACYRKQYEIALFLIECGISAPPKLKIALEEKLFEEEKIAV